MSSVIDARARRSALVGAAAGVVFASGLVLAGVTHPSTVLDAFRLDARWDPRLFAMFFGAFLVTAPATFLLRRRGVTLAGEPLAIAARSGAVDARLVVGATLFGVGWGLGGVCPGPAFVVALGGRPHAVAFFVAMTCGLGLPRRLRRPAAASS